MKKLVLLASVITGAFLTTGCKEKVEAPEVISVDRAGREISLPSKIERVVTLAPSNAQVLIDLGVTDLIVGADQNTFAQFTELATTTDVGSMNSPTKEKVVSLNPDVIITSSPITSDTHKKTFNQYIELGITVISVPSAASLSDIELDIQFLGKVFNKQEKATQLVNEFTTELAKIREIAKTVTKRVRIYSETYFPGIWTTGGQTFQNDIIEAIGAVNIFGYLNGHGKVAEEVIIGNGDNIDVIITTEAHGSSSESTVEAIKGRDKWNVIAAVKNNRVYELNKNTYNQLNHKTIAAIKQLAKLVYPAEYANI